MLSWSDLANRICGLAGDRRTMLHLAYDGTINGDWISHYAVRLAFHHPEKTLRLLHIDEGRLSAAELAGKLRHLEDRCRRLSVAFEAVVRPKSRDMFAELAGLVPAGAGSFLVCGARARERGRGYLAGTVSEKLLRAQRFHTLAVRVVQPGVLGMPRSLLLPVAGHPRGAEPVLPFLRLFAPDVTRLHVLMVRKVGRSRLGHLSHETAERLRRPALDYCLRVERELSESLRLSEAHLDAAAILAADVPKEIVIHASRTRSRLICLGASERSLAQRLLRASPIERVLHNAPCDVAVYRGMA